MRRTTAVAVITCLTSWPGLTPHAQPALNDSTREPPDATVRIPAFAVPASTFISDESRQALARMLQQPPMANADIGTLRARVDHDFYLPLLERAQQNYPVKIRQMRLAGVPIASVTPASGVRRSNRDKVLINLHGGSFSLGAGAGGLVESIPIAATAGIEVLSVDYRQGPEYEFPAASEDVAAVYRELLLRYKPQNIGIYGCSSGGVLTAMAVAWFQKVNLPRPGAIGIFCAPAGETWGGDSAFTAPALMRQTPPPETPNPPPRPKAYLAAADLNDPLIAPVRYPSVLARFPPTLLITGTRDDALSGAAYSQTRLAAAGVPVDLRVWEGMWHAFFYDPDLPESKEVFTVVADFFRSRLGAPHVSAPAGK